ncbi:MAG TPA: metallophosphoesterase family protein [Gaiellaceae bacterium]|nr:metallophosphoesterase family protein [Gaiellaceae bacterium]
MRVGLISDLHGNLPALEAVLAELENESLDQLVCLGDVAVGPYPAKTIARLRGVECQTLQGNWDDWLAHGIPDLGGTHGARLVEQGRWWGDQLSAGDRAYLDALPASLEVPFDGGAVYCFHGSPRSHSDAIHPETSDAELQEMLGARPEPLLAGGHTHIQLARPYGHSILVNPGSVGLPFERWPPTDGTRVLPWAEYAILESQDGEVSIDLRRVSYDVRPLLEETLASGVPHARWWVDCWDFVP